MQFGDFHEFYSDMRMLGYCNADDTCPCYPYNYIVDLHCYDSSVVDRLYSLGFAHGCHGQIYDLLIAALQNDEAILVTTRQIDLSVIPERWRNSVAVFITTNVRALTELM